MDWYLLALQRYAQFTERSRRKEYWFFFLGNLIASVLLAIVDGILGTMVLGALYALGTLVPNIAVTVRRLHDTDRSGWWFLLVFVPFIGWIGLLMLMCIEGQTGSNRFGADPRQAAIA